MYENKKSPLISKPEFRKRLIVHAMLAITLVLLMLLIGVLGHMYFDQMECAKALVASITITAGLGVAILPDSIEGQLFASIYGILSGYIYIATSTIVLAPILHRILHSFHLDEEA